ncbi:MAG: type VI secretion system Vgr family protein [Burkholderiales bacterium]
MERLLKGETPLKDGQGRQVMVLLKMSGHEELGRLPEFQLEFRSKRGDVKPKEILGKNVSWAMELANGEVRYFNGFVTRFAEAGEAGTGAFEDGSKGKSYLYRATVHPWLWFLTRASNCRIFQNMTVPDIVKQVFGDYSFATFELKLTGSYPQKEFSVQYRETDFNFVCRLLEQEGIHTAWDYDNGRNTLLLVDSDGPYRAKPAIEVPFEQDRVGAAEKDHITSFTVEREIQPGKYTIDDFDCLNPRNKMSGDALVTRENDLAGFEIYDYPGEYDKPAEGPQYAKARIEELQVRYEQFSGGGNVRDCAPGRRLKLEGHPQQAYNSPAEYLMTSVSYSASAGDVASGAGAGGEFHCSMTAIDIKTPFRPARITPKPIIQGPQTAIVVGPAGDEIYTDKHGRIKVQFHWDRYSKTDENSSCWMRVAQPLAGNKWGIVTIPRIGHEVIVQFLEGDPDHPIVIGSLYNGDLGTPYPLPAEKTKSGLKTHSSPNGSSADLNELRFEDKKGAEEIFIQAQKDKTVRIKEVRKEWIGKDSHLYIEKGSVYEELKEGDHHITLDSGDRNEKLKDGSLSLDISENLFGKMTKLAYDAKNEIHLKAGTILVLESDTKISMKVGGNFINIDSSGVTIQGTLTKINSGGSAGSGSGASPAEPELPEKAGETKGGEMTAPPKKQKPAAYSPQAQMFKMAAKGGTPFCEICNC